MAFSPANLTVSAGATVTWTNLDPFNHTSTSNTAVWGSPGIPQNGTYQFQFNTPGSYPYHCTVHPGMTGTITVQ